MVRLVGGFEVRDWLGQDLTPRPAKARALLALLCLAPARKRPRRWIEDKLWSGRGPEQAGSSLRQALTQIRRALGPDADLLETDRDSVGLGDEVTTDLEEEAGAVARMLQEGRELLEGFDIRDPEFEDWLRLERSRLAAVEPAAGAGPEPEPEPEHEPEMAGAPEAAATVCGRLSASGGRQEGLQRFLAQSLADQIAGLVTEFALVEVFSPSLADVRVGPAEDGLRLRIYSIAEGAMAQVLARLESTRTRRLLWSRRIMLTDFGLHDVGGESYNQLAFEAAEALTAAIPRVLDNGESRVRAHGLATEGVREMFTFDPARLGRADDLLGAAQQTAPAPVYDAWRALLKTVMAIERTGGPGDALREEARALAARALAEGIGNATVCGLVSQVRLMLDNDFAAGATLAADAQSLNAGNAFAQMAVAASHVRAGQPADGLEAALRANAIARNSPLRHWWDLACCLAQIANGRYADAIRSAEAAHVRAPHFKPPLRHLYALYTHMGDVENAHRIAERLRVLEPDFSMRRIREDPEFPAAVIRATPLVYLPDVLE